MSLTLAGSMSSVKPSVKDEPTNVTVEPSAGKLSDTMDGGTTSLSTRSRKYSAITPLPSVADTRT